MGEVFSRGNQFQVPEDHWKNVSRATLRRALRHTPLAGFPQTVKFSHPSEIDAYLAGPKVQCLLCGRMFKDVGKHLTLHDLKPDQYREMFGIPWTRALCSEDTSRRYSEIVKSRLEEDPLARERLLASAATARDNMRKKAPAPRPFVAATQRQMTQRITGNTFSSCRLCNSPGQEKRAPWVCAECVATRAEVSAVERAEKRRQISRRNYYKDLEHSRSLLRARAARVRAKKKAEKDKATTA